MPKKLDQIYSFDPYKNTNALTKRIDKTAQICGNCKHFAACFELYSISPKTKKCQLEPSKFKSKWAA